MAPVGLLAIWAGGRIWLAVLTVLGIGVALEWVRLCRGRWPEALAGIVYVGLAAVSLAWLRRGPAGLGNVLFVMLVVWAGDVGAYLAGRLIGGWRLMPAISPSKTWAGALGGLAASMIMGAGVAAAFGGGMRAVPIAALLAVVAQAGDLLESGLKRRSGAKDSGGLIPGHGGLLDRLDGLLAASPVACGFGLLAGQGAYLWA